MHLEKKKNLSEEFLLANALQRFSFYDCLCMPGTVGWRKGGKGGKGESSPLNGHKIIAWVYLSHSAQRLWFLSTATTSTEVQEDTRNQRQGGVVWGEYASGLVEFS